MDLRGTRQQGNGEDCIMGSLMICNVHQINKGEMGGACGTYGK
jgi:hypothetical protein